MVGSSTTTGLPTINVPIILNGWSQGVNQGTAGYQGPPLIVLDGTDATSASAVGLNLSGSTLGGEPGSAGSVVQGLDLVNWKFSNQAGGGEAITIEANNVTIQGNYIGVGPNGTTLGSNDVYGINDHASNDIIGGAGVLRNVIAGSGNNAQSSIGAGLIFEGGAGNIIQGNYIGVGADGKTAVPNSIGVLLINDTPSGGKGNTLGGTTSGAGNVISGNHMEGVDLDAEVGDTIQGNIIGRDSTNTTAVPNAGGGILAHDTALKDIIGGTAAGAGNVISSNTGNGVTVGLNTSPPNSAGIDIEGNSITANTVLGISLAGGTTPLGNDSMGHVGPNSLQNYPVLTSASIASGMVTIAGTFTESAEPNTTLTLDFFGDPGSSSGHGQGAVFLGTTSITTDATGVKTFSATVTAPPAGDVVTATATVTSTSASGITVGDTSEFSANVTPASAADHLVFSTQPPTSVVAGATFTVVVHAVESDGTTVDPNFGGEVTVALDSSGTSGGILLGTTSVVAQNGVATFGPTQALSLSPAANGYVLNASATGVTTGLSNPFNVTAPVQASKLVIMAQPTTPVVAGHTFEVDVEAEDSSGNLVTGFGGQVGIAVSSGPSMNLIGTTSVTAMNGVAKFTDLDLHTAGNYILIATSGNLTAATTSTIMVVAAPATHLVASSPTSSAVAVLQPFGLTITAEDSFGNTDQTFATPITVSIQPGGSATGTLGGTTTITTQNGLVAGVATFTDLTLSATGSYLLQATSPGVGTGGEASDIGPITVSAATDHLVVTAGPIPSTLTASNGYRFEMNVAAEDSTNTIDRSFTGPVTVSIMSGPSGATLIGPTTANAVVGTANFSNLFLDTPGTYTLEATSPGLTAAMDIPLTVQANSLAPTSIMVTSSTNPQVVGNGLILTTTITPTSGTSIPTGTVAFYDSQNLLVGSPVNVVNNNGVAQAEYTAGATNPLVTTIGTHDVYAYYSGDGTFAPSAENPPFAQQIIAAATHLVVTQQPTTVVAGTDFSITAQAENDQGQLDTTFGNIVQPGIETGPTGATFAGEGALPTAGVVTLNNLVLTVPGTYTLKVSAQGVADGVTPMSILVIPAATASKLAISAQPTSPVTAGNTFEVDVQAEDSNGNPISFNGPVAIAIATGPSGATLIGTTPVTASNGVAKFTDLDLRTAGNYTLTATTPSTSPPLTPATTSTIMVTAAAVDHLKLTSGPTPSTVAVLAPFSLAVAAVDFFGNTVTTYSTDIAVSIQPGSPSGTLGGTTTATTANGHLAGGVATFNDLTLSAPGTDYLLQARSDSLDNVTDIGPITVTAPVTATHLVVTTPPSPNPVTQGNPISLAVSAEDNSGNVDTSFQGQVTLSLSSFPSGATLTGTTMVNAVNGVATFPNVFLGPAGTFELDASASGVSEVTTGQIIVQAPITPTKLVVMTEPPSSVTVGSPFGLVVVAEDASGNVATGYSNPVRLAIATGSGTLGGTTTVNATNGVATFSGLTLSPAGTYTLGATSDELPPAATTPITAQTVTKVTPTVTVTGAPNPSGVGQSVTFTAVLTATLGAAAPTGTVTFLDGTTTLGTGTLNTSGVATFTTSTLAAGAHSITASYGGDSNYTSATSTAVTQQVNANAPTVTNLQRFGFHAQPTLLVLTFSAALDPSRANNTANYTVVGGSQTFTVTAALYNTTAHSVTLTFGQLLNVHHQYMITVNGMAPNGLTSVSGVLIDGANTGKPGSNYVKTFGMEILAGPASAAGINMATVRKLSRHSVSVSAHAVDALLASGSLRIQRRHHH
jgi:hypothetical protein